MRKLLAISILFLICFGLFPVAQNDAVYAARSDKGTPSDTLTVCVGYAGYTKEQWETKKIYTPSSLMSLPNVNQTYTWIDTLPAPCLNPARGVRLKDVIKDSGVDINSIRNISFATTDVSEGFYGKPLSTAFLFDETRYYYPNLAEYWDWDTNAALVGADKDKKKVDTIITVSDAWKRMSKSAEAPASEDMNSNYRFGLAFGMTDTKKQTADMAAYWIHTIYIELGGAPPKDEEKTPEKEGGTLDGSNNGNPPASSGEGTDKTASGDVLKDENSGESKSNNDKSKNDKKNSGSKKNTPKKAPNVTPVQGAGAVLAMSYDANGGTGAPVDSRRYKSGDTVTILGGDTVKRDGNIFLGWAMDRMAAVRYRAGDTLSISANTTLYAVWGAEAPPVLQSVTSAGLVALDVGADEGGAQPWRIHEIGEDAAPLPAPKPNNSMVWPALIVMIGCILLGGGIEFFRCRRDIRAEF
jgi:hypothetical protein